MQCCWLCSTLRVAKTPLFPRRVEQWLHAIVLRLRAILFWAPRHCSAIVLGVNNGFELSHFILRNGACLFALHRELFIGARMLDVTVPPSVRRRTSRPARCASARVPRCLGSRGLVLGVPMPPAAGFGRRRCTKDDLRDSCGRCRVGGRRGDPHGLNGILCPARCVGRIAHTASHQHRREA
jgi:hypothetical protein